MRKPSPRVAPQPEWPADKVERWPLARLLPYARNARTHSAEQVDQIAGLISEYGWTTPVLVDADGTLIAGHGRILAARKLGLATIPTMVVSGWSEAKRRAYRLADNRVALNSAWDTALLKVELSELRELGVDLDAIGFSPVELADLVPDTDLLDMQDSRSSSAFGLQKLKWGDKEIPLNAAELDALNVAYDRHYAATGVAFGFIGQLLRDDV